MRIQRRIFGSVPRRKGFSAFVRVLRSRGVEPAEEPIPLVCGHLQSEFLPEHDGCRRRGPAVLCLQLHRIFVRLPYRIERIRGLGTHRVFGALFVYRFAVRFRRPADEGMPRLFKRVFGQCRRFAGAHKERVHRSLVRAVAVEAQFVPVRRPDGIEGVRTFRAHRIGRAVRENGFAARFNRPARKGVPRARECVGGKSRACVRRYLLRRHRPFAAVRVKDNSVDIRRPRRRIFAVAEAAPRHGDDERRAFQPRARPPGKGIPGAHGVCERKRIAFDGIGIGVLRRRAAVQRVPNGIALDFPNGVQVILRRRAHRVVRAVFIGKFAALALRPAGKLVPVPEKRIAGKCRRFARPHNLLAHSALPAVGVKDDFVLVCRPRRRVGAVARAPAFDGDGALRPAEPRARPTGKGVPGAHGVFEGERFALNRVFRGVAAYFAAV